jgi:hypothetical protein
MLALLGQSAQAADFAVRLELKFNGESSPTLSAIGDHSNARSCGGFKITYDIQQQKPDYKIAAIPFGGKDERCSVVKPTDPIILKGRPQ